MRLMSCCRAGIVVFASVELLSIHRKLVSFLIKIVLDYMRMDYFEKIMLSFPSSTPAYGNFGFFFFAELNVEDILFLVSTIYYCPVIQHSFRVYTIHFVFQLFLRIYFVVKLEDTQVCLASCSLKFIHLVCHFFMLDFLMSVNISFGKMVWLKWYMVSPLSKYILTMKTVILQYHLQRLHLQSDSFACEFKSRRLFVLYFYLKCVDCH